MSNYYVKDFKVIENEENEKVAKEIGGESYLCTNTSQLIRCRA